MTSPRRPFSMHEPNCVHTYPGEPKQPMGACSTCKDSPVLQQWRDEWAAWLAANPDSDEAREIDGYAAALRLGGYPQPRLSST